MGQRVWHLRGVRQVAACGLLALQAHGLSAASKHAPAERAALQSSLRRSLRGAAASGIVLRWSDGAVLARVGSNDPSTPGSAIKPLLLSWALQHGMVTRSTAVYCRRTLRVGQERLPCTHPADTTTFTARSALAASCNTYFAAVADRMRGPEFEAALRSTGLTHADATNETQEQRELTMLGLRHVTGTPLQLASAYRVLMRAEASDSPVRLGLADSSQFRHGESCAREWPGSAGQDGNGQCVCRWANARLVRWWSARFAGACGVCATGKRRRCSHARRELLPRSWRGADAVRSFCFVMLLTLAGMPCANGCAAMPERTMSAGGRDVTVALFTARDVRSVSIVPTVNDAWYAACATCAHKPLLARQTLSSGEPFLGGTLQVQDAADAGTSVVASGLWHLRSSGHGMDVVLTLPSERYTAAAVSGEAAADEPAESLRALAVVARTYALNGSHYSAGAGHLPADLCDSTQCQALRFGQVSHAVAEAVAATAGETLWFGGHRAEVFFSAHCGGETADAAEAWSAPVGLRRGSAMPYLRHHADPFCLRSGPAAWHATITATELEQVAKEQGWHLPLRITRAEVVQRSASARAVRLLLHGADGQATPLSASSLRFAVGRALGWNRIRSDLYTVAWHDGALVLDGRGHGHGVGLCQTGAKVMANEHRDMRTILAFYFAGTHMGITPTDDGWLTKQTGAVSIRTVTTPGEPMQGTITAAWQSALAAFPVLKPPAPIIVFAPSTELFRQMTAQPGWDLASTRGSTVTLQPEVVLRRVPGGNASTLRHELLHVLVEHEAGDRAPLWLREGLVETLTSPSSRPAASLPLAVLEVQLARPMSLAAAEAAHAAAGARVRKLIARYGLPTVRGWLKSGVPSSVAAAM